jgi:hypothetical protein
MKKIPTLFILLLLMTATILSNQVKAQSCAWANKVGGTYEDGGTSLATDAFGNVYALGYFYSPTLAFTGTNTTLHNTYGGAYMYLAKYDSCGNFLWAKQANGGVDGGDTYGTGLATDAAGNVYVTGYSQADTLFIGSVKLLNTAASQAFIAKYNSSGIVQWAINSSGNSQNQGNAITLDANNNIYITGFYNSTTLTFGANHINSGINDGLTKDAFIAKFDNTGTNLWVKGTTSNPNTTGDVIGYGIGVDGSSNVYVTGAFESDYIRFGTDSVANIGYKDIFVVKYNTSGAFQWLKTAGDTDDDGAYGSATDATGNTYITGHIGATSTVAFGSHSVTNSAVNPTAFIAKYDASGTAQWAKSTQGDYYSYNTGNGITLDAGGNPYIIGYYSSDSLHVGNVTLFNASIANGGTGGDAEYDVFAAKYKANGILSWARTAGGDSNDLGISIAAGINNSLYITGEYKSPAINFAGITLTSTNSYGDAFIANNISTLPIMPTICLVTVDSLTGANNVIYWDKTPYANASSFVFYREVSTGVYKKIGSQPYSALSQFTDTSRSVGPANGDPNIGSYKYTLQILDTSGTYSFMSPYHNTVYFQNNSGTFSWNLYNVGTATFTPVTNFELMRDDNSTGNWHSIGSVAGTQTTLNDPNYSTYQSTGNWRVDADGFDCNPTLRLANGVNSTFAARVKSHSNQSNNRQAGIKQLANNQQVSVYPNPANTSFIIETTSNEKQSLQITDVTGKVVLNQTITGKADMDASALSSGVYNITIIGNSSLVNKKLVIVK